VWVGSILVVAMIIGAERGEAIAINFQAVGPAETFARHCAPCHGPTGEGTDYGPELTSSSASTDERIDIITNGSSAMPAFGSLLSADEIAQLADAANPLFVGGLYLQQCGPCHGEFGEGGVGPDLHDSTLSAADLRAVIGAGTDVMPGFATTLTPAQLDGLVDYVASLAPPSPPVADAETLFAQQCAGCHGAQGEGGAGPSLQSSTAPVDDLLAAIRDGRGSMPAYGATLTGEELDALATFSAALQVGPTEEPVERGAGIYDEHCSGCHGTDGAGGAGPNLITSSLPTDDIRAAVEQGIGTMPAFTGVIAAADLDDLMAFLEDLIASAEPDPTGPSLVTEGADLFVSNCARCHGPDASGGVGPSLKFSTLGDVETVSVISNGFGSMPSFAEILSSADVTALVAYLESTRLADDGSELLTAVEHGREVYVTSCATCHGLDATGGVGPSLAGTRLTANEIISHVFGVHAGRMPDFEGVLDASQVQDVARYVLTIESVPRSHTGWIVTGALGVVLILGLLGWYFGLFDTLFSRDADKAQAPQ
jgi:mono/diheme cytochrome c family protein